mmetsp:Transcript_62066/g.189545  ORF Transcript_62066/g.189545 Transcript_62066/m.189545 type:complete len:223 (+) Transcript_62066:556-1224(+)
MPRKPRADEFEGPQVCVAGQGRQHRVFFQDPDHRVLGPALPPVDPRRRWYAAPAGPGGRERPLAHRDALGAAEALGGFRSPRGRGRRPRPAAPAAVASAVTAAPATAAATAATAATSAATASAATTKRALTPEPRAGRPTTCGGPAEARAARQAGRRLGSALGLGGAASFDSFGNLLESSTSNVSKGMLSGNTTYRMLLPRMVKWSIDTGGFPLTVNLMFFM